MSRLDEELRKIEQEINELPIDINSTNFSKKRESQLGYIQWTIEEIFSILEKNPEQNQILREDILTILLIQQTTTDKIKQILKDGTKHELLYKRGEKVNIKGKVKFLIKQYMEIMKNTYNEITIIDEKISNKNKEERIRERIIKMRNIKKNIIFLYTALSENEQAEIDITLKKYDEYLKHLHKATA